MIVFRRNFPQGTISDMVMDVSSGVAWVFDHIKDYGGDGSMYGGQNIEIPYREHEGMRG